MKTIKQYEVAKWLEMRPATLANIFSENRRPSAKEADRLERITGIPMRDWMLSNGSLLRQRVFEAWEKTFGGKK